MEVLIGHHCADFFEYSYLTGAWQGGQGQLTWLPFADFNCLAWNGIG